MLMGNHAIEDSNIAFFDLLIGDRTVNIPFWVELAKQFGSPILEFACGSGRLTFPIARAGIEIVGLDNSRRMLEKGHDALQVENADVQARVEFLHADIRTFQLPQTFKAIFSPWGFHAATDEDLDQCLRVVKKHLQYGGYFVVDVLNRKEPTEDWSNHELMHLRVCRN